MNLNEQSPLDPVAIEILFRRYWSVKGWTTGELSAAEFAYAKKAGIMFEPIDAIHDTVLANALTVRDRISPRTVANAFVSSLSSRRLDLRSALGSYGALLRLVSHPYVRVSGRIDCAVCGAYLKASRTDINVLNFERFKWGGVRHAHPLYGALDLRWFLSTCKPDPEDQDLDTLRRVITKIGSLGPEATPGDAEEAIKGLFASNKAERRVVIDILGLAGVLSPAGLPTFFGKYPESAARKQPTNKNDWSYPVLWWRGSDGINEEAVRFWFPNF